MKLVDIARDMKTRAQQSPNEIILPVQPLAHGARLRLKYDPAKEEFRLQVQRNGSLPNAMLGPTRFNAWYRELETFARDFGATPDARVMYQAGAYTYAAVITWANEITASDVEEMEEAFLEAEAVRALERSPLVGVFPDDNLAVELRFGNAVEIGRESVESDVVTVDTLF